MESEKKLITASNNKRFIGDLVNWLVVVNTLVYIGVIVAHANGFSIELSPSFAEDGFCVSNKDKSVLWQSHALCFYEDTVFALFLWLLITMGKDMLPEGDATLLTRSAVGTFVHGAAHMSLAYRDYTAGDPDGHFSEGGFKPLRFLTVLTLWSTFMWMIHPDHSTSKKAIRGLFWATVHMFVPRLYAFSFVHCVLVMEFCYKAKQIKEVDSFYNIRTALLNIPNSILAWMEVFACEKYLQPYGGHAIYDAFIPITNIAYIFVLFYYNNKKSKKID